MFCSDLSSHKDLAVAILECFSSPSEEIKSAASFALGWFSISLFFLAQRLAVHTLRLDNIPRTYLCSIPVRHIPASCPWHISPHIPGIYPCIIPLGQSYPCQMGPHTMRLDHIPRTCLSHMSVRYISASYRRHISLHIPGTFSCIIPLGQPYCCQMGPHPKTLKHIPGRYLCCICVRYIQACFLSQAHFPAYPWDIFLHYTPATIIPLPNGTPVFPTF